MSEYLLGDDLTSLENSEDNCAEACCFLFSLCRWVSSIFAGCFRRDTQEKDVSAGQAIWQPIARKTAFPVRTSLHHVINNNDEIEMIKSKNKQFDDLVPADNDNALSQQDQWLMSDHKLSKAYLEHHPFEVKIFNQSDFRQMWPIKLKDRSKIRLANLTGSSGCWLMWEDLNFFCILGIRLLNNSVLYLSVTSNKLRIRYGDRPIPHNQSLIDQRLFKRMRSAKIQGGGSLLQHVETGRYIGISPRKRRRFTLLDLVDERNAVRWAFYDINF
ncbi:unnamed protein product [Clavelina lepadiformis]|uniref:Uncharacterized protein n=1 Tax=Clavelina lepadiformis TaxID=159417 RepID=A0ABP0GQ96_CLALP